MRSTSLRAWRPRPGEWDRSSAAHLFRRAGFGATPSELERALDEGLGRTLERAFDDDAAPELHVAVRPLLASGSLELLQAWWMSLILSGRARLRERMTLVWHDHFATSNDKVDDVRLMHAQNELFRAAGLGDFRALLHAVARDPAMLLWLDGNTNRRGHPNENFARELMELFALGIGHYGERDVQEAARAFSGWGTEGRSFAVRAEQHDQGVKTILGQTGNWDGDDAIDLVLAQPACSLHVARVLLEAFVAPAPAEDWIVALAGVLRANEWRVDATLHVLLSSELFFSDRARRSRIAGPVECLAVAARALDARVAPLPAARLAGDMGQALFRPPSVKGWDGGRAWINSGSWIARHNALVSLVEADGAGKGQVELALGRLFGDARAEELASLVPDRLALEGTGAAFAAALRRVVTGVSDPDDARRASVALVLTSPEFQLF